MLGQFARYDSSLAPELSELAILVAARIWGSGYEWNAHVPFAIKAGLATDVIDKIALEIRLEFDVPVQANVFEFAVEIHRDRKVSDQTYATALNVLGMTSVVDLVGIYGYYSLISMTINVFEIPSKGGPQLPNLSLSPSEMFR